MLARFIPSSISARATRSGSRGCQLWKLGCRLGARGDITLTSGKGGVGWYLPVPDTLDALTGRRGVARPWRGHAKSRMVLGGVDLSGERVPPRFADWKRCAWTVTARTKGPPQAPIFSRSCAVRWRCHETVLWCYGLETSYLNMP